MSNIASTDVLGRLGSREKQEDDDEVEGEKSEDEEQSRAEEEQLHSGDADSVDAALSASAPVTNQPPQEAVLATPSTQGHLELTNPASELTSLGKTNCWCRVLA